MKCTSYEPGFLKKYKYVVTFALYNGEWIFCKHRDRDTWETSGGHIENGETTLEAAHRELYEETGAAEFELEVLCDYWACDEPHEVGVANEVSCANGQVFLARVSKLGELPESEMERVEFFDDAPENLTYPDITREIFPHAQKRANAAANPDIIKKPAMAESILGFAFDCVDADALADFYVKLTGWEKSLSGNGWAGIHSPTGIIMAFQSVEEYLPPVWPWKEGAQQQMAHIDFKVTNLRESVEYAVSCGAIKAEDQYFETCTVMFDPEGHPFCLSIVEQ